MRFHVPMARASALGCAVLALAASPALARDWKHLDGKPVPEISISDWLNTDGVEGVADLRGKVFLIEFFATW